MERIGYTFSMMKASWDVLMKDKELLVFPLVSGICCILVLLSFALPMAHMDMFQSAKYDQNPGVYWLIVFAFYYVNYFVIIFFNSAVVACAIYRMRGGDPTLKTGFDAAMSRLPQIAGWAFVAAIVGLILRLLDEMAKRIKNPIVRAIAGIAIGLVGMAWSVVTFLVIPILVVEKKGPIEALKESARLLKKTWGEQIVGNFSFGIIFFLLSLAGIVPLVIGFVMLAKGLTVLGFGLIVLGILFLIAISLVQSVLQTIFQAAVYLYARDGRAPAGFPAGQLQDAMAPAPAEERG